MSLFSNNVIGPILGFLLGLIPLIIIHELGHFMMARLTGVWAKEFGIGYPPRILTLFHWKETAFTLNWLPLGGFVRMEGEELFEDPNDTEELPTPEELAHKEEAKSHSLYSKTPGQRTLIYLGGPVMNLISAWILAVLLFISGVPMYDVGIMEIAPNSPAAASAIQAGDIIIAINDTRIEASVDVQKLVQANLGQPTDITLNRNGEDVTVNITPRVNPPAGEGALGIIMGGIARENFIERASLSEALGQGTHYMLTGLRFMASIPAMLINGTLTMAEARPGGVISISRVAQRSFLDSLTAQALYPILNMLIFLNISLGIFNLLPIPALDGGRILFIIIEKIRQKPLTPEIEERIHVVAFMMLLALFVVITAMDILYPIQLP